VFRLGLAIAVVGEVLELLPVETTTRPRVERII
jgi:hypothetical protein